MKKTVKFLSVFLAFIIAFQGVMIAGASTATVSSYTKNTYTHQSRFDNAKKMNGLDVSEHNGTIDFKKVKASGIDFVFIRVGYTGYTKSKFSLNYDKNYKKYINDAVKEGLAVGVYWYSQALTVSEAKQEANKLLSVIGRYNITMPVVMDYEFAGTSAGRLDSAKLSKSAMTSNALAFLDEVNKSGYEACLYASSSFLNENLYASQISSKYKVWLAHYTTSTNYTGDFDYWQYSSSGKVNGINGSVDVNYWYMHDDSIALEDYIYTGSEITPLPIVTDNKKILTENEDYTLSYKNNVDIGSATVIATGINDYEGTEWHYKFNIVPDRVSAITIKSRGLDSLTFYWTEVDDAVAYYLDIRNDTTGYTFSKTVYGLSTTLNNLTPTNQYSVRVRAGVKSKDGTIIWGAYSGTNTKKTLPDNVTNLKVTGYTNKAVSLSWDTVKGATGYQVQVYRSGGWSNYGTTTSNKMTVSGLITSGAYLFRVRAYHNYNGKNYYSGFSNEAYQVTRANKISGFKATSTSNSVKLTWNAEPRVTGYRIYKYNASTKSFNYYKTVPSGTTTFTDTGLTKNTTYKYEIIGYRMYRDKMYFGYGGAGASATTYSVSAPSGLKVTGYTNKTTSLSWNKVSGANGYKVQVFRSGGWTDYATTTSNKITVTGLITSGAYLFRVQAYKNVGGTRVLSDYSGEVYQVTRANKISNFKVSGKTANSITLTWKAEPRVTGYRIYKYNDSTKTYSYYKTVPVGTTTFTDTGLKKNTTYKYEIIGYRMYRDKMYFGYGGVGTSAKTNRR